jgi:hypothetical protein
MTKVKLICGANVAGKHIGCGTQLGEAQYPAHISEREAKEKHADAYLCDDCAILAAKARIDAGQNLPKPGVGLPKPVLATKPAKPVELTKPVPAPTAPASVAPPPPTPTRSSRSVPAPTPPRKKK